MADYQKVDVKLSQLPKSPSIWFSERFFVAILLFFGYVAYAMGGQVVSIAIVEMVSKKSDGLIDETNSQPPKFQWISLTVGIILNTFYYGSLFSPVGGYLSHRFGGVVTFGVSMLLAGLLVFLTPFTLNIHFYLFLLFRGLVGVLESFCNASNAEIFSHWIPKEERPIFMASVINGLYFGTALTSPFCGFLIHRWGWPMAFYGTGTYCICWSLLWLILVKNDPSSDDSISKAEYRVTNENEKNEPPPYKSILSSASFWALSLSKFAFGGGSTFIVSYFPTYINDATQTNIKMTGILSSIPNFFNMFVIPIASLTMNMWQARSKFEETTIHKIILSTGFILSSIFFVIITLITVNLAPNYSGTISGLSLFWQTVGTIVTQILIGLTVKNHKLEEWNMCFLCAAGALIVVTLIFILYGSSTLQPWSFSSSQTVDDNLMTLKKESDQ